MNNRRRLIGRVTSNSMQKTVVVEISRTFRHPLFKKVVHSHKRVMAHDELRSQIGDEVRIVESRPLSKQQTMGGGSYSAPAMLAQLKPRRRPSHDPARIPNKGRR